MLSLSLTPHKGANHARVFPHVGYLGLSPVILAGTVATTPWTMQNSSPSTPAVAPLAVASVVVRVRCYEGIRTLVSAGTGVAIDGPTEPIDDAVDVVDSESFSGRRGKVAILWQTQEAVWECPPGQQFGTLDEWSAPWRIVVPVNAVDAANGCSAVGTMDFKQWKTWWQVEAVVHHQPTSAGVSRIIKQCPLVLQNHRPPTPCTPACYPAVSARQFVSVEAAHHRLRARLQAPTGVSSGDTATISLSLSHPAPTSYEDLEPISVKRVSVTLERVLVLHPSRQQPAGHLSFPRSRSESPANETKAIHRLDPDRYKLPAARRDSYSAIQTSPASVTKADRDSTVILHQAELKAPLASVDFGAAWSHDLRLNVPKARSSHHYSIGETCETAFASLRVNIIAKITFKATSGGTEILELPPLEVILGATSDADRESATQTLSKMVAAAAHASSYPTKSAEDTSADRTMNFSPEQSAGRVSPILGSQASFESTVGLLPSGPSDHLSPSKLASLNIRRRSATSDAIDGPNRRRPRSAGGVLADCNGVTTQVPNSPGSSSHRRPSTANNTTSPNAANSNWHGHGPIERRRSRVSGGSTNQPLRHRTSGSSIASLTARTRNCTTSPRSSTLTGVCGMNTFSGEKCVDDVLEDSDVTATGFGLYVKSQKYKPAVGSENLGVEVNPQPRYHVHCLSTPTSTVTRTSSPGRARSSDSSDCSHEPSTPSRIVRTGISNVNGVLIDCTSSRTIMPHSSTITSLGGQGQSVDAKAMKNGTSSVAVVEDDFGDSLHRITTLLMHTSSESDPSVHSAVTNVKEKSSKRWPSFFTRKATTKH